MSKTRTGSRALSKTEKADKIRKAETRAERTQKTQRAGRSQSKAEKEHMMRTVTTSLVRRLQEGGFILLSALSIFLFIALLTYHEADPGWSRVGTHLTLHNAAGKTGAWLSDLCLFLFGYIAYLFPVIVAYAGLRLFQNRLQIGVYTRFLWIVRIVGFVLTIASGCGLATLQFTDEVSGGVLGRIVIEQILTFTAFGELGSTLLLIALFLTGITLATGLSWFGVMDIIGIGCLTALKQFRAQWPNFFFAIKNFFATGTWFRKCIKSISNPIVGIVNKILDKNTYKSHKRQQAKQRHKDLSLLPAVPLGHFQDQNNNHMGRYTGRSDPEEPDSDFSELREKLNFSFLNTKSDVKEKSKKNSPRDSSKHSSRESSKDTNKDFVKGFAKGNNAIFPEVSLLEKASQTEKHPMSFSAHKLEALSREVESRLLEFGVQVTVVAVAPGPVITRFEMELAPGVKVSKITGLSKDLARALSVTRVRVVEVIPGKSVVGLEIPNEHRELVRLREIIESPQYQKSASPLTLALGKDISGIPVIVDLAKMPHLLVAGTTGSGKSVGVNAMLLSLLYKATPEEVRLTLIDPKMLELSIYDGIPHLLTPVVTDMKDAANVLRWCVGEMERRYQLMAAVGVRNLSGYNRKILDAAEEGKPIGNPLWKPEMGGERPLLEQLPYIVVIIDEFADMMMVVGKKVEELIARIAQKARAAGIHMILATQRPSVDVITGLIKANVPTRIAYQVSSRIDSRTILDQQGAEQLLGHGDMLYLPPGTGIPVRIHGAFVSDEEVHAVVKSLKQQGEPDYAEDILGSGGFAGGGMGGGFSGSQFGGFGSGGFGSDGEEDGEQDELYDHAVQIVMETRKTSISHLQRRLKIGYNRAARLIETMETAGILSAIQSNGSREVLTGSQAED